MTCLELRSLFGEGTNVELARGFNLLVDIEKFYTLLKIQLEPFRWYSSAFLIGDHGNGGAVALLSRSHVNLQQT